MGLVFLDALSNLNQFRVVFRVFLDFCSVHSYRGQLFCKVMNIVICPAFHVASQVFVG